jgi:hypothetical protein
LTSVLDLGFEQSRNLELILWGPHLKKVLYVGSMKENLFGKILNNVSKKQAIEECFTKQEKVTKKKYAGFRLHGGACEFCGLF